MKMNWYAIPAAFVLLTCGVSVGTEPSVSYSLSDVQLDAANLRGLASEDYLVSMENEDCVTTSCVGSEPFELFPATCRGVKIGGWTQVGYHNQDSIADLFNQNEDKLNLHQQWLYAERVADGSCGWDWGFRADWVYGIDGDNTQSFGNNPGRWDYLNGFDHGVYAWAIPQAYVEAVNGDLSIKMGHFFTPAGYEVVMAPGNFFYSHAFTHNNSEPFTHTGVLATYGYSDRLTLYGGWALGWDTGFDQLDGGNNFLGGFAYAISDHVNFTYISSVGDFGWLGEDAYGHSLILDVALTERLKYILSSDVMSLGEADLETVGIAQYLIYELNDCWSFGTRVEWWKFDGDSLNEATFGANWKPHTNFVMRPEVRHEWSPALDYDQTIFGVDAVLTY